MMAEGRLDCHTHRVSNIRFYVDFLHFDWVPMWYFWGPGHPSLYPTGLNLNSALIVALRSMTLSQGASSP